MSDLFNPCAHGARMERCRACLMDDIAGYRATIAILTRQRDEAHARIRILRADTEGLVKEQLGYKDEADRLAREWARSDAKLAASESFAEAQARTIVGLTRERDELRRKVVSVEGQRCEARVDRDRSENERDALRDAPRAVVAEWKSTFAEEVSAEAIDALRAAIGEGEDAK